jgi:hypothetical protein
MRFSSAQSEASNVRTKATRFHSKLPHTVFSPDQAKQGILQMHSKMLRNFVVRLVSVSLLSLGLVQASGAAMIGTQQVIQSASREARITRVETILARQDVARQLVMFGVDPLAVQSRVGNMTDAELLAMEGGLDKHVAGGDALAVIGTVFLVLLILELMGITDIFKAT